MEINIATKQDLVEMRDEIIRKFEEIIRSQANQKEYLTRVEVMEYLGCSHNTLYQYHIKGLLHPKRNGNKSYYKFEEVLKIVSH